MKLLARGLVAPPSQHVANLPVAVPSSNGQVCTLIAENVGTPSAQLGLLVDGPVSLPTEYGVGNHGHGGTY